MNALGHERMRAFRIGRSGADIVRIDHSHGFADRLVSARFLLDASHRESGGEHREKRIGMNQLGDAIRQRDQSERIEAFGTKRLAVPRAQVGDQTHGQFAE